MHTYQTGCHGGHIFHVMLSICYLVINLVYLNLSLFIINVCICSRPRCQSMAVRYGCPSGVRGSVLFGMIFDLKYDIDIIFSFFIF